MTTPHEHDNRRELRLEFEADCLLEPLAPPWTMLPRPLAAMSLNITENGLRLAIPDFPATRFKRWETCLAGGDSISVSVQVQRDAGQPLPLSGQVVWLRFEPAGNGERGACSLGILLAVPDDDTRQQLRRLMESGAA